MQNKLLNNSRLGGRSIESVSNSSNRYPALSKDQIEQASLVKKLPNDFPIASWEQMNTKQQLHAMKFSGLNPQEQWKLLNATAPLSTLQQHNQAQDEVEIRSYVAKSLAPLAAQIAQPTSPKSGTPGTKSSNSTPLQTTSQQRKLDMQQEEYETRFYEKAAARANSTSKPANPTKAPTTYKPLENTQPKDTGNGGGKIKEWVDNLVSGIRGILDGSTPERSTPKPVASTPTPFAIENIPSPKPPRMTPPPTPTPKPTPSERDRKAQEVVDAGKALADQGVKYTWGGSTVEGGMDCSGFVEFITQGTNLKFGSGNLSKGAKYMVSSFEKHKEFGDIIFEYGKTTAFPELMPGDLVFSADPKYPDVNKHITMATGDGLQVVEASALEAVNELTYQFDAYATEKEGKYYRDSGQIVTYVIRPAY